MSERTILVGVDGSPESVRAAALGQVIAERAGVACRLIHAAADYWTALSVPEMGVDVAELERAASGSARRLIDHSLEQAIAPALRASLDIEIGRAPIVLANAARRHDAEVVVLGGKRRRALTRLGSSTITHLVRLGSVPVLATDSARASITRVLAPVDLSHAAAPTIAAAERWAARFGAKLRILHCAEPMPIVPGTRTPMADDEFYRSTQGLVDASILPLVTYDDAELVLRRGRAAAVIAAEATQWRADLVVLGSHGKGWVDRLLIGSTSERLLQILPAPTLVVPVGSFAPSWAADRVALAPAAG